MERWVDDRRPRTGENVQHNNATSTTKYDAHTREPPRRNRTRANESHNKFAAVWHLGPHQAFERLGVWESNERKHQCAYVRLVHKHWAWCTGRWPTSITAAQRQAAAQTWRGMTCTSRTHQSVGCLASEGPRAWTVGLFRSGYVLWPTEHHTSTRRYDAMHTDN